MVDATTPPAPANLHATLTANNTQITLAWSPVIGLPSGVDHYNIYRNGTLYATSTTTSYTDTSGISSQSRYSYQVTAVNYDGVEGVKSTTVTAAPAGIAAILTPTTHVGPGPVHRARRSRHGPNRGKLHDQRRRHDQRGRLASRRLHRLADHLRPGHLQPYLDRQQRQDAGPGGPAKPLDGQFHLRVGKLDGQPSTWPTHRRKPWAPWAAWPALKRSSTRPATRPRRRSSTPQRSTSWPAAVRAWETIPARRSCRADVAGHGMGQLRHHCHRHALHPDRGQLHVRRPQRRRLQPDDHRRHLHHAHQCDQFHRQQHDAIQLQPGHGRYPRRDLAQCRVLSDQPPVLPGGGPSSVEVSAAAGSYTAWNSTNFHLIGSSASGSLSLGGTYVRLPSRSASIRWLRTTPRPP